MTPSLSGRLQTRLILTIMVGFPVGLYFVNLLPILLMFLFGIVWDIFYSFIQSKRWDRDWPPLLIAIGGLMEGLFLYTFLTQILKVSTIHFFKMYGTIFIIMFIMQTGVLNIFLPYRRHKAGRVW